MKIIFGSLFSDNDTYLTNNGSMTGWQLIHNYLEPKLLLPEYEKFKLVRFNITDKNTHYCLAIKIYNDNNHYMKIPYNEIKYDLENMELDDYCDLLMDCGLLDLELYEPECLVIH